MSLDATAIHAQLGAEGWRGALSRLGVDEKYLRNKHGPCPACGGKDRFRFDNKRGRGDFYCNQCGSGDGFKLIMLTTGCTFAEARKRVLDQSGITETQQSTITVPRGTEVEEVARPTRRVTALLRESCTLEDCEPVMRYLESRALWPMTGEHGLRAHPSVEYWHDRRRIGVYPALVATVRDINAERVTAHVTYLDNDGRKLSEYEPRKLLSGLVGRVGCAVRISSLAGTTLGIAEGIETALSATRLYALPVWAALNTSLLAKFVPPREVKNLVIFADRDVAGLDAASRLMQSLQGSVELHIRTPNLKDWNDALRAPNDR
jgi:putative DNA primase/helicase